MKMDGTYQPPNSVHTLTNDSTIKDSIVLEEMYIELIAEEHSDLKCSSSLFPSMEKVEIFMEKMDLFRVKCPDCGVKFSSQTDFDLHQVESNHKWRWFDEETAQFLTNKCNKNRDAFSLVLQKQNSESSLKNSL